VDQTDHCLVSKLLVDELLHGRVPGLVERLILQFEGYEVKPSDVEVFIDTDAKDCTERIYSLKSNLEVSKRRRGDIGDLQECVQYGDVTLYRHICGTTNPMDVLTKKYGKGGLSKQKATYVRFLQLKEGIYIPDCTNNTEKVINFIISNNRDCNCFYCRQ